ncbi:hypothetical protein AcW1_009877 [Taiwanofungus camphoratus]|nr:hypothetical protein AcV5_003287 [Antrodia cinnamomea]KAI0946407.1 hypothetical protein AcW1_009877 [Antrodia cinnamomea]
MSSSSSSTSAPASSAPAPTKLDRPKAPTACDNCRQRKLRCDGHTPSCSNCLLYETNCNYVKGRNKSGPPKGSKRKRTKDPSDEPSRQRRRSTASPSSSREEPVQMATPPASEASMSTKLTPRSISPIYDPLSHTSVDPIPTLMGPLPPDWLSVVGMSPEDTSAATATDPQFHTGYSDTMPYSFNDGSMMMDPFLLSNLFTDTHTSISASSSPPSTTSLQHTSPGAPFDVPTDLATLSSILPDYFQPSPDLPSFSLEDVTRQYNSSYLNAIRSAHAFVPLFPLPHLLHLVADCTTRKDTNIHSAFFVSALESLTSITAPNAGSSPAPDRLTHYVAAQKHSMTAYFATISDSTTTEEDSTCTAAGLIYLAVREVFALGWGKEASTWLRLAVDVVESMPRATDVQKGIRRWFARATWIWDKALTGSGVQSALHGRHRTGFGESEMEQVRDVAPLASLELDEYQREFSALVGLCLDLESMSTSPAHMKAHAFQQQLASCQQEGGPYFASLCSYVNVPLCQRVREWIKSSPVAQESLLQFGCDGESEEHSDSTREAVGRVLHLIYYAMAIKFDYSDRVRCGMKKSSLYVAVTRIVDAADWLVSSRRTWLWPFAEPALLLARDFLLDRSGLQTARSGTLSPLGSLSTPSSVFQASSPFTPATTVPPSSGELTLLSLIRDVFVEASASLEPTCSQKIVAAHAVEGLTNVLEQSAKERDPVSRGEIMVGIRQLLAGIQSPSATAVH